MEQAREYVRLDGGTTTLVIALARGDGADLVYLGARLPASEDLCALAASMQRNLHESQPDAPPVPGLLPERKAGWSGTPAIAISHSGNWIETDFRVRRWNTQGRFLEYNDDRLGLSVEVRIALDDHGVAIWAVRFINHSQQPVTLDRLASLALPVPARFTEVTTYSGRWAGEMHENRRTIAPDGFANGAAIGKPGFGAGNWLLLHDPATGEVLGAHIEWSGDYTNALECDNAGTADSRARLQMAARWEAGEITLAPGETFDAPGAILARGGNRDAVAQVCHTHLRCGHIPLDCKSAPRRVHLNSWEALGFDLSQPQLLRLADDAAGLGVERFVLDDGWFAGRRGDRTSLGDWFVSPHVFPNGLDPLIDHVHALGMDFGLWVEPEMVSPGSDLYRAQPDWCLYIEDHDRPTMRGQLVLDLTREDVSEYLFERLDALLRSHAIAYLKWDHNRDLFPRASKGHAQTLALYRLIDRLRETHHLVEIESCASGGGRIDYAILSRTHRVWPSDNNDPIERLRIIAAWSQFLPLEVLGNHVGPSPNPITGRRTNMDFRAKVAMFGHMGIEADPRAMREADRANLAAHIALYKEWRGVLHAGKLTRIDHRDPGISGLMVTHKSKGLAIAAQTGFSQTFDVAPVRLGGLDPEALYRITLPEPWPARPALYLAGAERWRKGLVLSGRALATHGLALPLTHPETAWLIALEKIEP